MTFATEVATSELTEVLARDAKLDAKTHRAGALKTERLVLRAPSHSDVVAMAALAGDRRVAENTARIPHPYTDATEAARALIDYAFARLGHEVLSSGARVSNPASRRVLEKCGFQWTGVQLCRIRAINSAAPIDRFRLDRGLWASLKAWGQTRQVA